MSMTFWLQVLLPVPQACLLFPTQYCNSYLFVPLEYLPPALPGEKLPILWAEPTSPCLIGTPFYAQSYPD